MAAQFRRDLASTREIVLQAGRSLRRPRLVGAPVTGNALPPSPAVPHKRFGYELGAVAVVALRRVAGGLRRAIAGSAALTFVTLGGLLLLFPKVMSIVLAAGAFWLALGFGLYAFERRQSRKGEDGD